MTDATARMPLALRVAGVALFALLLLPVVALLLAIEPASVRRALEDPGFATSLGLSLRTSLLASVLVAAGGTPLAWWMATRTSRARPLVDVLVTAPIVLPPAVLGVGLLVAFGANGPFGALWRGLGWSVPFTTTAVVLAQVVVAAPFYVQAARASFQRVDSDLLLVARTLGATPGQALWRVAIPSALPGLLAGASLAWARALGEFGATLLFAGNRDGVTRTAPLATYNALEADVGVAVVLAIVLVAMALVVLGGLLWLLSRGRR